VFKKFTSFTPHQYLQNVRLKHGQVLLKSSSLPIADISSQAGFNSADYFATAFKQKYGATSTEFRGLTSTN
jgi:AraC family transcriptional regulator